MLEALCITEAEAAGLSELAALDLAMARDFAARAQAAEDPDTANALARSYQRMARSYRQTLALKAKLRIDTLEADRETPRRAEPGMFTAPATLTPEDEARIDARADRLRDAVERVIWAEHEPADPAEVDPLDDDLGYHLDLLEERLAARPRPRLRTPAAGRACGRDVPRPRPQRRPRPPLARPAGAGLCRPGSRARSRLARVRVRSLTPPDSAHPPTKLDPDCLPEGNGAISRENGRVA